MSNQFKTIGLIGKYGDPHIADTLATMANFLTARQLEVMLDDETARTVPGLGLPTGARDEIDRNGEVIQRGDAFNDVVVHKWNMPRMIEFETHVNRQFMDVQRSDGSIVSTPTGSTAYALSGGGPILMPTLNAIALVPICPHTLSNRPVVGDGDSRIDIVVCDCKHNHAQMTCDGQSHYSLMDGDHIVVRKKYYLFRLIHPANHDYFHILRAKLRWGSRGE